MEEHTTRALDVHGIEALIADDSHLLTRIASPFRTDF